VIARSKLKKKKHNIFTEAIGHENTEKKRSDILKKYVLTDGEHNFANLKGLTQLWVAGMFDVDNCLFQHRFLHIF
jgi:hypothetical protein